MRAIINSVYFNNIIALVKTIKPAKFDNIYIQFDRNVLNICRIQETTVQQFWSFTEKQVRIIRDPQELYLTSMNSGIETKNFLKMFKSSKFAGMITIEKTEDIITIKTDNSEINIKSFVCDEHVFYRFDNTCINEFTVKTDLLKEIIKNALPVITDNASFSRNSLKGLCFKPDKAKNIINVYASDSHRCYTCRITPRDMVINHKNFEGNLIITKSILKAIADITSDEYITISYNDKGVINIIGDYSSVISYTIPDFYPDIEKLNNYNNMSSFLKVDYKDLLQGLKELKGFENSVNHAIELYLENCRLVLKAENKTLKLDPVFKQDRDFNIIPTNKKSGYNLSYLLDAVKTLKYKTIKINFPVSGNILKITDAENENNNINLLARIVL